MASEPLPDEHFAATAEHAERVMTQIANALEDAPYGLALVIASPVIDGAYDVAVTTGDDAKPSEIFQRLVHGAISAFAAMNGQEQDAARITLAAAFTAMSPISLDQLVSLMLGHEPDTPDTPSSPPVMH